MTKEHDRTGAAPACAVPGADEVEAWMVLQIAVHLRGIPTLPVSYRRNEAARPAPPGRLGQRGPR
jgi:hypothetical protein